MTHPVRIVLRADAGPGIGLGHLQRTLALGAALLDRGASCVLVAQGDGETRARAAGEGISFEQLRGEPGSDADLEQVAAAGGSAAVVDSYAITEHYLGRLSACVPNLTALDDLAAFPFPCRLVVNARVGAESMPYRAAAPETKFLLGPRYALMRRALWPDPEPERADAVRTVLVTLGGADERSLTEKLAVAAADAVAGADVIAVRGPFAGRGLVAPRTRVRIIDAPRDLRPLMEAADVAISAGGHTATELARLGVPAVLVRTASNQEGVISGLAAAGAAVDGGEVDSTAPERVAEALAALVRDPQRRAALAMAGRTLIDGRGAHRVAAAILADPTA